MSDTSSQICAICLSTVESDDSCEYIQLECTHQFHCGCTTRFNKRECPQCRSPLSINDNEILKEYLQHLTQHSTSIDPYVASPIEPYAVQHVIPNTPIPTTNFSHTIKLLTVFSVVLYSMVICGGTFGLLYFYKQF